jgi:ADYC domain-containing protein
MNVRDRTGSLWSLRERLCVESAKRTDCLDATRRKLSMLRTISAVTLLTAVVLSTNAYGQAVPDRIANVDVDGTVFRVRMASGKVLSGPDLVGATLSLREPGNAEPRKFFIESVAPDPMDPDHEVLLYHVFAVDPATQQKEELCGPNAQGERWAFPVRGRWDIEGRHITDAGYTLTCSDGAQGKCVRFGYKPWKTLANGVRLDTYHQACIRLVRADYCGGHGTTRDGMLIDIYDTIGIQELDPQSEAAGVRFEAAWSPAGAVCVAHTRVPENITLDQLAKECPRLVGRLGEEACTEERARHLPAPVLLYNRSR